MKIECLPGQKLTDSEYAVLNYIEHQQCIIELLSLEDIAKGAFVSNATVSRTIRKCGYSSFSEMKYRLSEKTKKHAPSNEMNRVLSKSYTECVETIKRIDISAVLKIVQALRDTSVIYLLANGLTALIANEFAIQLQCQKMKVCLITDSEMMKKLDLLVTKNDLVFVLSVKNSTPELAIGLKLAKEIGAKTVVCCCTPGTPLEGLADTVLYGYTQPISPNRMFGGTSRLALMIITRTIVEYIASENEILTQ